MDRCGVFIDAGHLLAEAGGLCLKTKKREEIDCHYVEIVKALIKLAEEHSGHPVLRLYWYDGAPDGVPLPWHLTVADLPHVKLRMGRIVGEKKKRRQKGVDSLIVRDLIVLARERAICTAYLLAGDEDLREGVATAQEDGLQVVLLGIPPWKDPANQAGSLIREADEHVILDLDYWKPYFTKLQPPAPVLVPPTASGAQLSAREIGRAFAEAWANRSDTEELNNLLAQSPRIPMELDVQMIVEAEQTLGSLRGRDEQKRDLRAGFWEVVRASTR